MQVDESVMGSGKVGVKVEKGCEVVAFQEAMWAMCRWKMVVKWQKYLVEEGVHFVRHGEGFTYFDEGEIDMETWSVRAREFDCRFAVRTPARKSSDRPTEIKKQAKCKS